MQMGAANLRCLSLNSFNDNGHPQAEAATPMQQ